MPGPPIERLTSWDSFEANITSALVVEIFRGALSKIMAAQPQGEVNRHQEGCCGTSVLAQGMADNGADKES